MISTKPPKARRAKKIVLWFPGGGSNMGNECTLAAAIEGLRKLDPDLELYGVSWNPHDTALRHGIVSVPIKGRRGPVATPSSSLGPQVAPGNGKPSSPRRERGRFYRTAKTLLFPLVELERIRSMRRWLRNTDLLVFVGTGPLQDSWGGWRVYPYRIFLWTYLSRLCGARVAIASIGAGPIDGAISKRLLASAVSQASYRSFRDESSKRLIEGLGVLTANEVCPDLVFGSSVPERALRVAEKRENDIIVTGLPYRKPGWWYEPNTVVYDRYLDAMAEFVRSLIRQGRRVRLLGTQALMDPVFIDDLQTRMGAIDGSFGDQLTVDRTYDFEHLMEQIAQARLVVTARFHAVVFSYKLGVPVLGVSYHEKIRELMSQFGQQSFCLEIEQIGAEDLKRKFRQLEEIREQSSSQILQLSERYRASLDAQYRKLLQL